MDMVLAMSQKMPGFQGKGTPKGFTNCTCTCFTPPPYTPISPEFLTARAGCWAKEGTEKTQCLSQQLSRKLDSSKQGPPVRSPKAETGGV
jgi:hypothetical protein